MPGYTHMKAAMPSSFGLWFSAYAETLIDDVISLNSSIVIVNQNTLGSAAGYGTSFNIDRDFTTKDLNFKTLKYNSLACQISRNKIEKKHELDKYDWQKPHQSNPTGTENAYYPNKDKENVGQKKYRSWKSD